MESFGLFVFMVSACVFSGLLEHKNAFLNQMIPNPILRLAAMAAAMACTALFIFLSPLTSPSGAFINPSVTIMRWRLGQLSLEKLIWYSIFQTAGGLLGVYFSIMLMGSLITAAPVNCAATVPGEGITLWEAAGMEMATAYIMIVMVLFVSDTRFAQYTPYFSAILVGVYVMLAGPVSGFGMNPARTIASAVPAGIYTGFWIYMLCPTVGMLLAAETYLKIKKKKPAVDFKLDGED